VHVQQARDEAAGGLGAQGVVEGVGFAEQGGKLKQQVHQDHPDADGYVDHRRPRGVTVDVPDSGSAAVSPSGDVNLGHDVQECLIRR
jgi:hypothetical protein